MNGKCGPGADQIVAKIFQDCVYNPRDYIGFILGLASIVTWMVAQLPQVVSNFRNKSAEALSPWFLAEWLMGDTCNLIGCLLTGSQLITQTYTAVYFICADIILVMQYTYYGTIQRRRLRAHRNQQFRLRHLEDGVATTPTTSTSDEPLERAPYGWPSVSNPKPRAVACLGLVFMSTQLWQGNLSQAHLSMASEGKIGRQLLEAFPASALASRESVDWSIYVGQCIGWVSSAFYLGSRLAQIYKNWSRQSAEGLSIAMFVCAITANVLYGAGILFRAYSWSDIVSSAPWLLGSLGTVFLDIIIYSQFSRYSSKQVGEEEAAGLLSEPAAE